MRGETLRCAAQFAQLEVVQVPRERLRQVFVNPRRRRPQAAVRERQLPERRRRPRRLRRPAPADVAEDGVVVG